MRKSTPSTVKVYPSAYLNIAVIMMRRWAAIRCGGGLQWDLLDLLWLAVALHSTVPCAQDPDRNLRCWHHHMGVLGRLWLRQAAHNRLELRTSAQQQGSLLCGQHRASETG